MARFASYRTDRQALCRLMERLTRRRQRLRQAVFAAFVSALSFGIYAETPAVDLFVKLRAHSARKAETMTLEDLAALVDETDKELQSKGRVMVKQPDVWGQNRLTGPRDKYDKILKGDLDSFKFLIQGYRAELDNAALAYEGRIRAAMLRNAEGQRVDAFTDPDDLSSTSSIIINSQNPIAGTFSDASSALPTDVLNSGTTNNLKLANDDSGTGIGLEPTSFIDQKSRYLNHIHQKLRNNMGDDKTDMPGYGLYLMRMPVSVMPGSNTMRDNGAMVTAEIKHNLTPDLLKQLMQRVITREATFNLAEMLKAYDLNPSNPVIMTNLATASAPAPKSRLAIQDVTLPKSRISAADSKNLPSPEEYNEIIKFINMFDQATDEDKNKMTVPDPVKDYADRVCPSGANNTCLKANLQCISCNSNGCTDITKLVRSLKTLVDYIQELHLELPGLFAGMHFTLGDIRHLYMQWSGCDTPEKPGDHGHSHKNMHQPDMYLWLFQELANTTVWFESLMTNDRSGSIKAAAESIRSSYQQSQTALSEPLLNMSINQRPGGYLPLDRARVQLFDAILRSVNRQDDYSKSGDYNNDLKNLEQALGNFGATTNQTQRSFPLIQLRNRMLLAYTYILHGAIVNEQLTKDMKIVAQRKGTTLDEASVMEFDCLNPDDLAQSFFMDYVQAKWPIQVFSLDPDIEQQNEAEALSRRTDLQVALAAAIATGQTDMNQALQFSRRIEQQFATVGLNRTAVGFTAGATTFGWKFYPRLQTPPAQSNPERIASTIFMGGPTRRWDMAHRQIEPGPRECVALVVAPNFVPALRMTTTTNWFDLTPNMHHGNEKISNTDMIRLGRQITMARHAFQRLCDDGHYRPGDIERLQDRITQLENMLPSQTTDVQLPFEGDWYGMELFASDGARLAPKLLMWNGEPGLKSSKTVKSQTTDAETGAVTTTFNDDGALKSIFLVGQGFVIGESKVIIGGAHVPPDTVELMSRNVMRVTIPADADTITLGARTYYDLHVATPNGVSNHLYVETSKPEANQTKSTTDDEPKYGVSVVKDQIKATYQVDSTGKITKIEGEQIELVIADPAGLADSMYKVYLKSGKFAGDTDATCKGNKITINKDFVSSALNKAIDDTDKEKAPNLGFGKPYGPFDLIIDIEKATPKGQNPACLARGEVLINKQIKVKVEYGYTKNSNQHTASPPAAKLKNPQQSGRTPQSQGGTFGNRKRTQISNEAVREDKKADLPPPPKPRSDNPQATPPAPSPSLEMPKAAPLEHSFRQQSFESTESPVRRNPAVRPPYAASSRNGVVNGGNPQNKRLSTNPSTPNQDALRASRLTGIPLPKP
jgi:hypothetical protein